MVAGRELLLARHREEVVAADPPRSQPPHRLPLDEVGRHDLVPLGVRTTVLVPGPIPDVDDERTRQHLLPQPGEEELTLAARLEEPPVTGVVGRGADGESGPLEGRRHQPVHRGHPGLVAGHRLDGHPAPARQPDVVPGLGLEGGEHGVLVGCEVDDRRGPRDLDVLGLAEPERGEREPVDRGPGQLRLHLDAEGTREGAPGGEHLAQLIHGGGGRPLGGVPEPAETGDVTAEKERRHRHRGVVRDQIGGSPAPAALEFTPGAGLEHVAAIRIGEHEIVPAIDLVGGRRSHGAGGLIVEPVAWGSGLMSRPGGGPCAVPPASPGRFGRRGSAADGAAGQRSPAG